MLGKYIIHSYTRLFLNEKLVPPQPPIYAHTHTHTHTHTVKDQDKRIVIYVVPKTCHKKTKAGRKYLLGATGAHETIEY